MPIIKPISDLRNYPDVLKDVGIDSPVFLTKNGRGKYAILDITDFERMQAIIKLMDELEKGRVSGEKEYKYSAAEVRAHFREKTNEE